MREERESEKEWIQVKGRDRNWNHRSLQPRRLPQRTSRPPSRHLQNPPSRHLQKLPSRQSNSHPPHLLNYTYNPHRNASRSRRPRSPSVHLAPSRFQRPKGGPSGVALRGRSSRRNSFFTSLEKECTSYFFTNFPEDFSTSNLWIFFGKIGAVGDIAVPKRRDARGKRFGFVRFKPSEDRVRLDKAVKNLFIGKQKLTINKPRFSRGKVPLPSFPFHGSKDVQIGSSGLGKQALVPKIILSNGSWSDVVRKGRMVRKDEGTSGAKSVLAKKAICFEPICNGLVRLASNPVVVDFSLEIPDSLVVQCDDLVVANLEFGQGESDATACLARNGVLSIQVIPVDYSTVILKGLNFVEVEEVFNSEELWWRTVFASFTPWDPFLKARDRNVWIRCTGIPIHVWSVPFFKRVANSFGRFVKVSKDTFSMKRIDYGFVLVVVNNLRPINLCCNVIVKGVNFEVGLAEMVGWSIVEPKAVSSRIVHPNSEINSDPESSQDFIPSSSDDEDEVVYETFLGSSSNRSPGILEDDFKRNSGFMGDHCLKETLGSKEGLNLRPNPSLQQSLQQKVSPGNSIAALSVPEVLRSNVVKPQVHPVVKKQAIVEIASEDSTNTGNEFGSRFGAGSNREVWVSKHRENFVDEGATQSLDSEGISVANSETVLDTCRFEIDVIRRGFSNYEKEIKGVGRLNLAPGHMNFLEEDVVLIQGVEAEGCSKTVAGPLEGDQPQLQRASNQSPRFPDSALVRCVQTVKSLLMEPLAAVPKAVQQVWPLFESLADMSNLLVNAETTKRSAMAVSKIHTQREGELLQYPAKQCDSIALSLLKDDLIHPECVDSIVEIPGRSIVQAETCGTGLILQEASEGHKKEVQNLPSSLTSIQGVVPCDGIQAGLSPDFGVNLDAEVQAVTGHREFTSESLPTI